MPGSRTLASAALATLSLSRGCLASPRLPWACEMRAVGRCVVTPAPAVVFDTRGLHAAYIGLDTARRRPSLCMYSYIRPQTASAPQGSSLAPWPPPASVKYT